ncbi:hypothetical protein ACQEVF_57195 [Nonomuraea polychroma]|uniref:hypothetical protein n=1 Tax=Nonomuraea polychroma TaxID=46176 RepID=UPI003D8E1EAD
MPEHRSAAVPASAAPPWVAPHPRELPDWRRRMVGFTDSPMCLTQLADAVNAGQTMLLPTVPGTERYTPGAIGGQLLQLMEGKRLREAQLYYATADMTSLALAAAATPPAEPISRKRLPAPEGLIVFEDPIGGYTQDLAETLSGVPGLEAVRGEDGNALQITTPIVAVSWQEWTPHIIAIDDDHVVRWLAQIDRDQFGQIDDNFVGVALTFYAPSEDRWRAFAPDAPVSRDVATGDIMTAGMMSRIHPHVPGGPLVWDNETLLSFGASLPADPRVDSTQQWVQVVYTAWQMITQRGKRPIVDVEDIELPNRASRKLDARSGITRSSSVRVINVHAPIRPKREQAEQDAATSSGRRAPNWTHRWPVPPYRRNTCLNPRQHKDGGCEHEEQVVPFHIKGPEDKPLKVGDTVRLWDHQPEDIQPS